MIAQQAALNKDSLQLLADSIKLHKLKDNSELLYYLNNFYEQAWIKLLWVIGGGAALIGLIIPYWQRKDLQNQFDRTLETARREIRENRETAINETRAAIALDIESATKRLQQEMINAIESTKTEMLDDANQTLKQTINEVKETMHRLEYHSQALGFHNQARIEYFNSKYGMSCISYFWSLVYYLRANNMDSVQVVIKNLQSSHFDYGKDFIQQVFLAFRQQKTNIDELCKFLKKSPNYKRVKKEVDELLQKLYDAQEAYNSNSQSDVAD